MSADIKNLGASIRQRLKNKGRDLGVPFAQVLQRYVIERFLFRLSQSKYRNAFVLKGAQMFVVWGGELTRPTMDIDFQGITENSLDNLERIVRDLCEINTAEVDALRLAPESVKAVRIKEDAEYEGVRVTFAGTLDSASIHVQIDVGFDDAVTPAPVLIHYPSLLGFQEPELRGYNRESLLAEKFEAMVKLGELNSRMKDFFDIWLLSQKFSFEGEELLNAMRATFEHRGTVLNGLPVLFNPDFDGYNKKQTQWTAFLRKSKLNNVPPQFCDVTESIAAFIKPLVAAISQATDFDATWNAGGPWSDQA